MEEFKTYRDPEASLWQSALEEAAAVHAAARAATPALALAPFKEGAARAAALIHGLNRVLPAAAAGSDVASAIATGTHDPSLFGAVVAHLARNFTGSVDAFRDLIRQTKFSFLDPLWLEAAVNYYLILQ
jgi:hypothetical protein